MAAAAYSLGLDLGGTKIEAALFDGAGHEVWRRRLPTPAGDYAATLNMLVDLVRQARDFSARRCGSGTISVGIGTPGSLGASGRMKNCNSVCLNGMPLQADLQAAIGQAVPLANDANCLALSEASDGAGAGAAVVFAVILGTGTGAGISVDGRLLTGPNGLAGEWGHNPLPPGDGDEDPVLDCYCGQRGCVETLVSGPGLARDHALRHGGTLTAHDIADRAAAGDAACTETLRRHCRRLARALATVINLLDPDVIVLGGGLSRMPHLLTQVPLLWSQWVFNAGAKEPLRTRLAVAQHGDASGVRGAAWLGRGGRL